MIKQVSVVGIGKLGSPLAAVFASKGYPTIGLDVNSEYVQALHTHRAPVSETGLQELIDQNKERLSATSDWGKAVMGSDASFIIVPTPSGEDHSFSNRFVVSACKEIGAVLKAKKAFHLVVVVSTMMPGSSEKEIIPALEESSGKKAGVDFGYCYGPALIALGSVIHDFLNPDLLILGEGDVRSGEMFESFYRTVVGDKPSIHRVTLTEAELAKISLNTYITMKISFANMIGMVAHGMGIRAEAVTGIVGSDSRVGKKYLKPGGSFGGPCFPRDNRAFSRAAELVGVRTYLPQATDLTNGQQVDHVAQRVRVALAGSTTKKVGIIGVAYKPDTEVTEEAMGMRLAHALKGDGIPLTIYDPLALAGAKKTFGDAVEYADSFERCVKDADVVVITNPYQFQVTTAMAKGKVVIDCWKAAQNTVCDPGVASALSASDIGLSAVREA